MGRLINFPKLCLVWTQGRGSVRGQTELKLILASPAFQLSALSQVKGRALSLGISEAHLDNNTHFKGLAGRLREAKCKRSQIKGQLFLSPQGDDIPLCHSLVWGGEGQGQKQGGSSQSLQSCACPHTRGKQSSLTNASLTNAVAGPLQPQQAARMFGPAGPSRRYSRQTVYPRPVPERNDIHKGMESCVHMHFYNL